MITKLQQEKLWSVSGLRCTNAQEWVAKHPLLVSALRPFFASHNLRDGFPPPPTSSSSSCGNEWPTDTDHACWEEMKPKKLGGGTVSHVHLGSANDEIGEGAQNDRS